MNAPQIIMIILLSVNTAMHLAQDGEPRGNYNFWMKLLTVAITVLILIWGGFFE